MEVQRKSLGRARISSTARAMDRAITRALADWGAAPRRLGRADDTLAIARLADQLRHGSAPGLALVTPAVDAARAISFVNSARRRLLEDARDDDGALRADELSSLVLSLDSVAEQLAARHEPPGVPVGPSATDLIVEIAHDIRSPLTSILFLVETLRNSHSGPVNSIQERQLALVYSAAFGLSAMASDIVDLARGSDRLIERSPIAFSVREVFQSVCDILMPMVEEKGFAIRSVPPAVDFRVGYVASLSRVLLNLATNAVKFTRQGFVELAATQLSATRIEFSVRDTGPGIPRDVLRQLFEPIRGNAAGSHTFSSAGLGLAICARLVSAMHSELSVVSSETGTRFAFELELPPAPRL